MGKMLFDKRTRNVALITRCVLIVSVSFTYMIIALISNNYYDQQTNFDVEFKSRRLLNVVAEGDQHNNCTPAAINEFPSDGLTKQQRQSGLVVIHALVACYLFILLAVVCDDYFIPAIKRICDNLHLKEDIAGATFMATASSSPELFINIVGTFITEGDIGVGTIVGSAVFNVLAVPACCGLFTNMVIDLHWWPITRDSIMYGTSVIMLIAVLKDGQIQQWEAAMLVFAYIFYILMMCYNDKVISGINRVKRLCIKKKTYKQVQSERRPLLQSEPADAKKIEACKQCEYKSVLITEVTLKDCEDYNESEATNLWEMPQDSLASKIYWIVTWPISFILFITVPDCRKYPKIYFITFLMCIIWIGSASYVNTWLITVVGDTLNIPDSVMGLTFLAAGTSVPEAVSSVIVTNQGHGSMGLSSSIGSNTFDILLCLGLPWLIKTSLYPKQIDKQSIVINSGGLSYSAVSLFSTLILFYLSLLLNKFRLDWKIGLTCLLLYIGFLIFASLVELNVFFPVNLPTCTE